jgi:hypothetical protein
MKASQGVPFFVIFVFSAVALNNYFVSYLILMKLISFFMIYFVMRG